MRYALTIGFFVAALAAHAVAAKCNPVPGLTKFYSDSWGNDLENHRLQCGTSIASTRPGPQ